MLSIPDMALLSAAALLLFGPEQLPKVLRKVGQFTREVQNTSQTFIREMERAAEPDPPPYVADPYAYDPLAYETPASETEPVADATPAYDTVRPSVEHPDPPAPDPEPPDTVSEKLAEPRGASEPAQPSPQDDHPAHV
ncbi:MAG TPA: twin-arginine translocase TatA/TatE family subunit [Candidatus Elarobacter sp.]|jgi:Sec-independent protein translocase protein TatA